MLESPMAPYLLWAKTRTPPEIDLAGSNLLHCTLDDLPGVRDAVDLSAPNDNGYRPLVDSIARHYGVTPDRVVTAAGCSGANFLTIAALVGAGDEVLIERPSYDPIAGACRLMGARLTTFERRHDDGWRLDLDAIRAGVTSRTRLIALTSPHNPSGCLLAPGELEALAAVAREASAHVLIDEVYLDGSLMLRPGTPRRAAATIDPVFVSTSSLTKSYGLAGLRAGWIIASNNTAERLRRTRDLVDNAGSAPADRLAALAFEHLPALADRARRLLAENVAAARRLFDAHPELALAEAPHGSIVFPKLTGVDDAGPFVERLLERYGVAVAPGAFFHRPAHFRISLAGPSGRLGAGLDRLGAALDERGV